MLLAIQQRIVEIELPLCGGYSYFSGYILADGVVITCAHGFSKTPNYDSDKKLRLSASNNFSAELLLPAAGYAALLKQTEFVLYHSPVDQYDLLVFCCKEAKAPYQELQISGLYTSGDWEAGGFPFFARENKDTKGYRNFHGTFSVLEENNKSLNLKVQPTLKEMSDWASVSGSPVFIRGQLAGIVRQYSTYTDDKKRTCTIRDELQASCLVQVLKNEPEFKALIERLRRGSFKYHYQKIKALLANAGLCQELAKILGCEHSISSVLGVLTTQTRSQWRLKLRQCAESSTESEALITPLFQALMAYHYEQSVCLETLLQPEHGIHPVPVAYGQLCEFLMSAHDGVDPVFRRQQGRIVASKYNLTAPPEYGINSQLHDQKAVANAVLGADADDSAVIDRLFGDFMPNEYAPKDKKALVLRRLVRRLEEDKRHYYWPVSVEAGQERRIQELHQAFSLIKILQLTSDIDVFEEDELLVSELERFIKD